MCPFFVLCKIIFICDKKGANGVYGVTYRWFKNRNINDSIIYRQTQ